MREFSDPNTAVYIRHNIPQNRIGSPLCLIEGCESRIMRFGESNTDGMLGCVCIECILLRPGSVRESSRENLPYWFHPTGITHSYELDGSRSRARWQVEYLYAPKAPQYAVEEYIQKNKEDLKMFEVESFRYLVEYTAHFKGNDKKKYDQDFGAIRSMIQRTKGPRLWRLVDSFLEKHPERGHEILGYIEGHGVLQKYMCWSNIRFITNR